MPVGGAAVEWSNWIKGLKHEGADIGVITWKGANKYIEGSDIDFELVETFSPDEGIKYLRILNVRLPHYIKAIKKFKPDIVIQGCASITTGLLCLASKISSVPFVYRAANDMDADERHKQRMSSLEAKIYQYGIKNSNAIICQNQYQLSNFKDKYPKKNYKIVYNPFNFSSISDDDLSQPRKYIAWLGVFQSQKNLPALYEIVNHLPEFDFRIGGKKSSAGVDKATQRALDKLESAPNVKFEGYIKRTNISSFLSGAHLLLNTSHYEGFSNTFLESFAVGTPIVTTKKVDPDHIIEKYNLGAVGEGYDELPKIIKSLIGSKSLPDLSDRCIEYVKQNHDHFKLAAYLYEYLNVIAKNKKVSSI